MTPLSMPTEDGYYWLEDQSGRNIVKTMYFDPKFGTPPRYVQFGWDSEPVVEGLGTWYKIPGPGEPTFDDAIKIAREVVETASVECDELYLRGARQVVDALEARKPK